MLSLEFYSAIVSVQACLQLEFYVLFLKQVLFSYILRCGLRTKFSQSQEEYSTYKHLFLELYTVQFGFYSIISLHTALLLLLFLLRSGLRPRIQSHKMPRPTKNSAYVANTGVSQENSVILQESSSSYVEMDAQSPQCFQPSTSQPQSFVQPMFMPYIEGPNMD